MTVLENVSLAPMTTFRIGGAARYFTAVTSEDELVGALSYARERKLPVFVLGGGSNILVADEGFPGLVIRVGITGMTHERTGSSVCVSAGAGVAWDGFVSWAVGSGLYGVENLSGIPGTVGATPIQNVGAYGAEVRDVITRVDTLDAETGQPRSFVSFECAFGYRDSFFKSPAGKRYIITRVHFNLSEEGACNTSYHDLSEYFARPGAPAAMPQSVREAVLSIRRGKFPDLARYGTAGSFFRNPVVSESDFRALAERFPELPGHRTGDGRVKIPLAWILDHVLRLRGERAGDVGAHETQPIVIVNYGNATSREIGAFAEDVRARVHAACGIDIEREIVCVP